LQTQGHDHAMQPFDASGDQSEMARGSSTSPSAGGTDSTLDMPGLRPMRLRPLTSREQQVVQLAAEGLTAREIGARLFIGERTVETHLANSYTKLGVGSKRELMRSARLRVS
jgi:DNA-binding NarL/FixJ family response regulator